MAETLPSKDKLLRASWIGLSRLGQNKILKTSYAWIVLVPIAAKLLSAMPEVIWFGDLIISVGLPFSWKAFYFSAVFFGIATALYSIRCPALIKDFKNWTDYEARGLSGQQLRMYISHWLKNGGDFYSEDNYKTDSVSELEAFAEQYCEESLHSTDMAPWQVAEKIQIDPIRSADAFWEIRRLMDLDKPLSRGFTFACYLFGFALLALVLLSNFFYVFKLTFTS